MTTLLTDKVECTAVQPVFILQEFTHKTFFTISIMQYNTLNTIDYFLLTRFNVGQTCVDKYTNQHKRQETLLVFMRSLEKNTDKNKLFKNNPILVKYTV